MPPPPTLLMPMKLPPPWYVPEMSRFPSRRASQLAGYRIYFRSPYALIWPAMIGYFVIYSQVSVVIFNHFPALVFDYRIPAVIAGAISGFGFLTLIQLALLPVLRRQARKELNRWGVPVCIRCGYDLRGNDSPRCPECGKAVSAFKAFNVQK